MFGINMDDYKVSKSEGYEWKSKIPAPLIKIDPSKTGEDKIIKNVHHIDFHSAYPGALAEAHPEFRPMLNWMYKMRKEKPEYKQAMDISIGYMQYSKNPIYAKLSYDANSLNVKKMLDLAELLTKSGRTIIGYNTDGIWYEGEVFHGKGEGKEIGNWENDHVDCTFRAKSDGAYEYIENGKYFPVVRGTSSFERDKPRDKWEWGDTFKGSAIQWNWDETEGFIAVK